MAPGAAPLPLPARDMAPRLEWVFPLRWHPLMQRLRALLQDHVLTSPVLSPPATQASPWQAPGRRTAHGSRMALGLGRWYCQIATPAFCGQHDPGTGTRGVVLGPGSGRLCPMDITVG